MAIDKKVSKKPAVKKPAKATKPKPKKTVKKPAVKKEVRPDPVIQETTEINGQSDRIIRTRTGPSNKNASCPKCKAFPTITKIRRPDYELRRCRECGHRFEIKKGGD
jgi:DNA-directed RNA polymerase subunit M/transcription elongation factor TFIIS